jgi:hypothetical protein
MRACGDGAIDRVTQKILAGRKDSAAAEDVKIKIIQCIVRLAKKVALSLLVSAALAVCLTHVLRRARSLNGHRR